MISLQAPLNMTTQHLPTPSHGTASGDVLGYFLIFLSSVLVGIWAVKGTIALRNILLGVETVIAIIYCTRFFKTNTQKIPLKYWTPLILLGLMFCWVIFHYLFLVRFSEQQFHELTSTWFRSGLAVIVAIGTGLALQKRPNAINCLWIGILASFGYLFYQYIPNALALKSLFAPDYVNYIFYGKISGVLVGTILIAGLLGTLVDTVRREPWPTTTLVSLLCLTGLATVLYAYVFIFDTRNGIGLAAILITALCLMVLAQTLRALFRRTSSKRILTLALLVICTAGVLSWFGVQHIQHNPGWSSMWEDTKTSIQVEKYPNWQNPQVLGYPNNATGQVVKFNTYVRVAWGVAGLQIFLPENPFGVGVLKGPFTVLLKEKYPSSGENMPSTHSAWVEIGLAFGYPGLFLMLGAVMATLFLSLNSKSPFSSLTGLLSLGLICLYTAGEVSSQHSVEILCFWIALLTALQLPRKINNGPA